MVKQIFSIMCAAVLFGASAAFAGPLHEAAKQGDAALVAQLLDQGAAIEEPDSAGDTALILAALGGHMEAMQVLIDRGADLDGRNARGLTALHAAAYGGHTDLALVLIKSGADVNDTENFFHMSPLHAAAEEDRKGVVEVLLANGADIEAKERNGYSPLTQAGWREFWDTADVLMKAGAQCQPADLTGDWLFQECTKRK